MTTCYASIITLSSSLTHAVQGLLGEGGREVGSGPSNVVMRCLSNLCKSQQNFWHTSSVHSQSAGLGGHCLIAVSGIKLPARHKIHQNYTRYKGQGVEERESNGGTHATC